MKNLTLALLASVFLFSCKKSQDPTIEDPIACTEIFTMIPIQVEKAGNQQPLTQFYTIDIELHDTIRENNFLEGYYIVISDNYQQKLKNDTREFLFEGLINDEKVVSEVFVIKADECHIEKVSGVEKVVLP